MRRTAEESVARRARRKRRAAVSYRRIFRGGDDAASLLCGIHLRHLYAGRADIENAQDIGLERAHDRNHVHATRGAYQMLGGFDAGGAMLVVQNHEVESCVPAHLDDRGTRDADEHAEQRFTALQQPGQSGIEGGHAVSYSSFRFAVLTTCAQRAFSSRMNVENCSGVLVETSAPCAASRSFISGVFRIFVISVPKRATISFGVFGGATTPCHEPV